MTVIDIQRRLRELARIRIGDQTATQNGGKRPRKLEAFRITSRDEQFVNAAAERYGGEPRPWAAPDGPQFEVYTSARELPVVVPPTEMVFSQAYEMWSAGGCQRRCDGAYEQIGDRACVCNPDNRECKITTRLSLILHELPGLGVCRLETHGFYAATEIGGAVELVQSAFAQGQLLPARLVLEQRQVKRVDKNGKPQTRNFVVPCLDFPMSFGALTAGLNPAAGEIGGGAAALASPGLTPVPALAGPSPSVADQVAQAQNPPTKLPRANAQEPIARTGVPVRARGAAPALEVGGGGGDGVTDADTSGQSSPPPDDEGPSLPLASRVAIWCGDVSKELHPDLDSAGHDEWRHAFLAAFSEGAYQSARDVPEGGETVARLRAALVRVKKGEVRLDRSGDRPMFVSEQFGWETSDPAGEHQQQRAAAPDFSKMKVRELNDELVARRMEQGGTRAEMIARLEGREVDG